MSGRIKNEIKYKKEQDIIMNKIIEIIELDNNIFYLYDIENNENKIKELLNLIEDIKKYFSLNNMKSIKNISNAKRPYMCIIRNVLKQKYNILSTSKTIYRNDEKIISIKYTIINKYL